MWRRRILLPSMIAVSTLVGLAVGGSPAQAATCPATGTSSDDGSSITCVTSPVAGDARLVDLTIHSTAMNADESVRLLLPTSYDTQPDRTWPVLYLLHGGASSSDMASDHTDWSENTDVESQTAGRNVIVAMPDGGSAGWYSDWVNDPARWETFHTVELRQLLERNYRAGSDRAIAGLSMGGFGALSYAGRHPGDFKAVAAYSGVAHPFGNPQQFQMLLAGSGKDINALWGDPTTASGAATWQQHDPYYLVDNLTSIPVYISSGDGTPGPNDADPGVVNLEKITNTESQAVAQHLTDAYVAAHPGATGDPLLTTHFYSPGVHTWPYWSREFDASLPTLLTAINA